jgi:signal transduction histidine kinase
VVSVAYLLATLPYQNSQTPPPIPHADYWRIFITRLFFLILVSALARRISANVAARNREIALLHEQKMLADDRARIAREIHDGLGHAMVSSILRLELCSRLIRKAPEEAEAILKEEVPALRAAWNEGRDLAFHLRPWEVTNAGSELVETLRRHIGRFAERTGLVVELKAEEAAGRLRPHAAFGLTRIVQEALTNAAKHAEATTIEVTLAPLPSGGVTCTIRDNGKGFAADAEPSGLGLATMRDRAEALGGTLRVHSAPGSGTEIVVTLPA